ncbi:hypothetical protein FB451DRAFT_1556868 [Mycena latifolia]|nr:hypothetical protein FB451DRAFT_1556868 [Mycena latifolia]
MSCQEGFVLICLCACDSHLRPHMWLPHSFFNCIQVPRTLVALLLLLLLPSYSHVNGEITTTKIDDTDPRFSFPPNWNAITPSTPCGGCGSQPDDISQIYEGTWHDGSYMAGDTQPTTGLFTFTGSAVEIYGIDTDRSQANIVFTLGSTTATHHYSGTTRFSYNVLFFSTSGLAADQSHVVSWTLETEATEAAAGVNLQDALFDYAIVTSRTAETGGSGDGNTESSSGDSTNTNTGSNTDAGGSTSTSNSGTDADASTDSTRATSISSGSGTSPSTSRMHSSSSASATTRRENPSQTTCALTQCPNGFTIAIRVNYQVRTPPEPPRININAHRSSASGPTAAASHARLPLAAILGGVLGTLILIALGVVALCVRRRRRRHQNQGATATTNIEANAPARPRLDVAWNRPSPEHGQSQVSLLAGTRPREESAADSARDIEEGPNPRERLLEARVAQLEAHIEGVVAAPPPPYVPA